MARSVVDEVCALPGFLICGRWVCTFKVIVRFAVSVCALSTLASACAVEEGTSDEYGRRHDSFAEATAHRQAEYNKLYSEIQPLPVSLGKEAFIVVPSRAQIYNVIRAARPGHSEVYLQNNTNYMEVDAQMLPRLVEKRNLFDEVRTPQGQRMDTLPPDSYLIEFVLDVRGMHIFVTQGADEENAGKPELARVELPRPWVGAKDDKTAIWAHLNEIESFLISRTE